MAGKQKCGVRIVTAGAHFLDSIALRLVWTDWQYVQERRETGAFSVSLFGQHGLSRLSSKRFVRGIDLQHTHN